MMTPSQGSMLLRRIHWRFDPITTEQYQKLDALILMSKLTKAHASQLIGALIDVETNRSADDASEAKKEAACKIIQTVLAQY